MHHARTRPGRASLIALAALLSLAALLVLGALGALGGAPPPKPTTVSVHLTGSPGDFQEVILHVRAVQAGGEAGDWVTLGVPDARVNLLRLTGGVVALLADGAALPPGHYERLRLLLGPGSAVRLLDGSVHALALPTSLEDGLELELGLHVDVDPSTSRELVVDLDVAQSVRRYGEGSGERWVLEPVGRAFEQAAAGGRPPDHEG